MAPPATLTLVLRALSTEAVGTLGKWAVNTQVLHQALSSEALVPSAVQKYACAVVALLTRTKRQRPT